MNTDFNHSAEKELLDLANEKGKFAIQLGYQFGDRHDLQEAFERGIDEEWFTFVDVSALAETGPMKLMKVYRLTQKGWDRKRELDARKA